MPDKKISQPFTTNIDAFLVTLHHSDPQFHNKDCAITNNLHIPSIWLYIQILSLNEGKLILYDLNNAKNAI